MSTQEIGYADALSELQQILGELEAEDIDIDVLAVKVERAAELIRVCRGRINDAEVRGSEGSAGWAWATCSWTGGAVVPGGASAQYQASCTPRSLASCTQERAWASSPSSAELTRKIRPAAVSTGTTRTGRSSRPVNRRCSRCAFSMLLKLPNTAASAKHCEAKTKANAAVLRAAGQRGAQAARRGSPGITGSVLGRSG